MACKSSIRALNSQRQDPLRPEDWRLSEPRESDPLLLVSAEKSPAISSTEHLPSPSPPNHAIFPLPSLVKTPAVRNNIYKVLPEGQAVHHSFTSAAFQIIFHRVLKFLGKSKGAKRLPRNQSLAYTPVQRMPDLTRYTWDIEVTYKKSPL